jgi:hypothetical protein
VRFLAFAKSKSQKSTYLGVFFGFCQTQKAKKSHNKRAHNNNQVKQASEILHPSHNIKRFDKLKGQMSTVQ